MVALLSHSVLKTAMSEDPGTEAPPDTPQALPEVADQLAVLFVLPPAEPTQYLEAACV